MKYFCLLFSALWFSIAGFAQIAQNWDAFAQKIDVTSYQGKKFRLEAAVRVAAGDSLAKAELWTSITLKNNKTGFFKNMSERPIKLNEWKTYSIEGKIDRDAKWLIIGGLYFSTGTFCFDDFRLSVETKKGDWEMIPVADAGFEQDTDSANGVWIIVHKTKGFTKDISTSDSYEGNKHLQITGKGIEAAIEYGNNPAAGKYASVNGIKLYYETYGSGSPLLLLHGNRSPIGTFYKQIPEFEKYFKVIAVDTRGQGKSNEDGKPYSYDLFAADMNAFLDSLKLDSVDILGWSDGGNTGLIMAMKYPDKVKRLVTMGADVFIDTSVVAQWVFKEVKKQMKEFKEDTSYNSRNNYRLADLLITEPNHTFAELESIKCPVLVMAGENDIIKENHTKGIAAHIPKGTLMLVPKATHDLPEENPALFNKIVIDFFREK